MKLVQGLSLIGLLASLLSRALGATNQVFSGNGKAVTNNVTTGIDTGVDTYTMYTGDGGECSGWPGMDKWVSFESMWQANLPLMSKACSNIYNDSGVPDSSTDELQNLRTAIDTRAAQANLDHRLVLASIMQESHGCVRIKTTISIDGKVRNPGLMQGHDGDNTCNVINDSVGVVRLAKHNIKQQATGTTNSSIFSPCPSDMIYGMIKDGVSGTDAGDGLAGVLNLALTHPASDCRQSNTTSATPSLVARQSMPTPLSGKWCRSGSQSSNTNVPSNPIATNQSPAPPFNGSLAANAENTGANWWPHPSPFAESAIVSTTITRTTTSTVLISPVPSSSVPASSAPSSPSPSIPSSSAPSSFGPAPQQTSSNGQPSSSVNAQTYYRAARLYNAGQLDVTNLGNSFMATNCYASDIANRLTGWTGKDAEGSCSRCTLDMKPGASVCPWGLCKELCPKSS